MTGRRHYLTEIIPPGPRAVKDAEKVRTRLMSQVNKQRNPRTRAPVDQLLDQHLEMLGVARCWSRPTVWGWADAEVEVGAPRD